MRLELFLELKYESRTVILFVGIRYSMPDLHSVTMPGPQTGDMLQVWYMMSALPLASARFSKL